VRRSLGFWGPIAVWMIVFCSAPFVAHGAGMTPWWALLTGAVVSVVMALTVAWIWDQVNTGRRRARERRECDKALRCYPGPYHQTH